MGIYIGVTITFVLFLIFLRVYGNAVVKDRKESRKLVSDRSMFDEYVEAMAYIRRFRAENTSVVIFNWHITHRIKAFKKKWDAVDKRQTKEYVASLVNEALRKEYEIANISGKALLPYQEQSLLSFISNN